MSRHLHRLPHAVDVVLERELRRVDSNDEQSVVAIGLRPRAHVRLLAQPVDARQRPEVDDHHVAAELGGTEWVGLDPPGRPAEGRHAHTLEDAHLERSSRNAARTSVEKSSGSSQAAKWPPLSTSLKYARSGYATSTQLRGAAQTSSGNVVKPTGTDAGGGGSTAKRARARPSSQ